MTQRARTDARAHGTAAAWRRRQRTDTPALLATQPVLQLRQQTRGQRGQGGFDQPVFELLRFVF